MGSKTCFIAAPIAQDLGVLTSVLDSMAITWEWAKHSSTPTDSIASQAFKAIEQADFVIAVFSSIGSSPFVWYEIGLATALKRPVIGFGPHSKLGTDFAEIFTSAVPLTDDVALKREIKAFSATLESSAPQKARRRSTQEASVMMHSLPEPKYDGQFERHVADILRLSGAEIITSPGRPSKDGWTPDMLAWFPKQKVQLLNPIAIEVKGSSHYVDLAPVIENMRSFLRRASAATGLIVLNKLTPRHRRMGHASPSPDIFVIELAELENQLRSGTLGQYIRVLRNRAVHGLR